MAPHPVTSDEAFLAGDAADRRAALTAAIELAGLEAGFQVTDGRPPWHHLADSAYRWLRSRDTLRIASVAITPGTPRPEGTGPMTTTINLDDVQEVTLSLTGLDARGVAVALPAGYTATWTLADPDASGAVLTPSADGTTAVLVAGTPDVNVMVSVSVSLTNPDGSTETLAGAEAVIVTAGPVATIGITAGTPAPVTPPATSN